MVRQFPLTNISVSLFLSQVWHSNKLFAPLTLFQQLIPGVSQSQYRLYKNQPQNLSDIKHEAFLIACEFRGQLVAVLVLAGSVVCCWSADLPVFHMLGSPWLVQMVMESFQENKLNEASKASCNLDLECTYHLLCHTLWAKANLKASPISWRREPSLVGGDVKSRYKVYRYMAFIMLR